MASSSKNLLRKRMEPTIWELWEEVLAKRVKRRWAKEALVNRMKFLWANEARM